MKQRIIVKALAVAVILLFLGLVIQSSVANDVSTNFLNNIVNLGGFEQLPYGSNESWIFYISDADADLRVWDKYWDLLDPICPIEWWGLSLVHPWTNCNPEGMVFEIIFWDQLLGNPICTYQITPYVIPTGIYYNGAEMYQWEIELDPCCDLIPYGWISIQSIESPNNCWFHWAGSGDGDLYCYHEGASNPDCDNDCAFRFPCCTHQVPIIQCDSVGMNFGKIDPGETVTGQIFVYNSGDPGSYLNWYVDTINVPLWGSWTFYPKAGYNIEEGDYVIINVTCSITDKLGIYTGEIIVYNGDDSTDFCIIDTSVEVPRIRTTFNQLLYWFLERFPLLERLLVLIN